jgi:transposase-like protein
MKYCPRCKSSDIHPILAGFLETYQCKKCSYNGTLVIEKNE